MSIAKLTQEELKRLLDYNLETGVFTWKVKTSRRVKVGAVAGGFDKEGYILIQIARRNYRAHRLAFLWVLGALPLALVDHIDMVRSNNAWNNLRECSKAENMRNTGKRVDNTSGYKGVYAIKGTGKFKACACLHGKHYSLGPYATAEEASKVREAFVK